MQTLKNAVATMLTEEDGQGLVEYALILALVSVAAIAVLKTLSGSIGAAFTKAGSALTGP